MANAKNQPAPKTTAMAVMTDRPAYLPAVTEGAQTRGSENVGAEDLVIPRIEIVQDLSPCRKKTEPSYIEGAEEGLMYNNVTRRLYGREVTVVPVMFRKEYLIWKDRKQGGGFRGAFSTGEEAKQAHAALDPQERDFCEITDTGQQFVMVIYNDNGVTRVEEAVISMAKSKMKVSRNWNSLIRINGGDRFSRAYKLTTVAEKNTSNQSYFNFQVTNLGYAPEMVYRKAEELYSSVAKGRVIDIDRTDESHAAGDGASGEM
jgi:hypothetical protein